MATTIILAVMMMAGLFLMLFAGVGFVQDEKFFSSAPKAVTDAMKPKQERFRGQHAVGWVIAAAAVLMMLGALVLGGYLGIKAGFGFGEFYIRFAVMLILLKAFDIVFFDWVLLCNSGFDFFARFYPEVKPVLNRKLFGYNKLTHIAQTVGMLMGSAVMAWGCTLIK